MRAEDSWKRSDLNGCGKQAFKKNYWSAVLVSLVLAIVTATGGSGRPLAVPEMW